MAGMKTSITGMFRNNAVRGRLSWSVKDFTEKLYLLKNDPSFHKEFFEAFVFEDEPVPAEVKTEHTTPAGRVEDSPKPCARCKNNPYYCPEHCAECEDKEYEYFVERTASAC